ncbi:hypothetical protein CpB0860 [Chlamydia pneumoniae TW-183]|uniref:Uncharacterized protein CPn0831 n=2 Tax=Chlamydia pneumoniae TaxID=83558 RepID=Q9Z775_CHLPN|nr:hypothetical protein [Chlamydia pneumoniae]AAD18968.1 hypothetical protein CPn_0831 [Chlamydia pneumoniae CWL029]AAF38814.1 hypothetical protein CP_1039 [Chlamydia pneumoniae AR39]AAP98789.1 hypothetical protein CpB0860 [Chlamydia pneumoniae TW-183]CRI33350.1 Putative uncharacterized protein CPn0831 [Chlamydia pneumoniae]CRI36213.1 Putative uncharacterized protein CPn0831 [Chlamydia pneumoniae]
MLIRKSESEGAFFEATQNYPTIQQGYQLVRIREHNLSVRAHFDLSLSLDASVHPAA